MFLATGQSKFDFHSLLAEDRRANPPEIAPEDFHSIGLRNIGIQDLAQLGGVAAAWAVAAPDKAIHPQFPDRILHHAGIRIRARELPDGILAVPNGADP